MKSIYIKSRFIFFLLFLLNISNSYSKQKATSVSPENITYEVKSGDTWYGIAKKFSITYPELKLANKNIEKLFPGQKLSIPSTRLKPNDPYFEKKKIDSVSTGDNFHIVKKSETLYGIARMHGISVQKLKELNGLKSNSIKPGQKLIISASGNIPEKSIHIDGSNSEKLSSEEKKNKQHSKEKEIKEEKLIDADSKPPEEIYSDDKIVFSNDRVEVGEKGKATLLEEDENGINKYYAFHRSAPVGTVVQLMNPVNAKIVYVKITGQLAVTPENEKFLIKISKASAEKLGVIDKEFDIDLLYGVNKK